MLRGPYRRGIEPEPVRIASLWKQGSRCALVLRLAMRMEFQCASHRCALRSGNKTSAQRVRIFRSESPSVQAIFLTFLLDVHRIPLSRSSAFCLFFAS